MANELTAILFALGREAAPFLRLAGCRHRLDAPVPAWRNAHGLTALVTGMGAARSRAALDWLLRAHRPTRVISAGYCGSLVEAYRVGNLIRPGAILGEDDPPHEGAGIALVSVSVPVLGIQARRRLHARTHAAIVDMESATVKGVCEREGIAFDCLRVVTDDLSEPLPAELSRIVEGERVRLVPLLAALVRRPALLSELLRLAKRSRVAARILAEGLRTMASRRLDRGPVGLDGSDDGVIPPPLGLGER